MGEFNLLTIVALIFGILIGVGGLYFLTQMKNKSSEKLPISRLPMFSTNMSDAFKYYICRKNYIRLCKETVSSNNPYSPKMH